MKPYFEKDGCRIYNCGYKDFYRSDVWFPALEPLGIKPSQVVVVSDPPYNVGYHYEGYKDNLSEDDYYAMLAHAMMSPSVMIHYPEAIVKFAMRINQVPKRIVAWVYPSNTARQWRSIAWFGAEPDFTKSGQDYKNPNDKRIKKLIEKGRRARLYDWWEVNQVKNVSKQKTDHPCQIPLEVMKRIVEITEAPLIMDPFMGSGTTLLAAQKFGRKAIGIEINEKYCEIAAKRLEKGE